MSPEVKIAEGLAGRLEDALRGNLAELDETVRGELLEQSRAILELASQVYLLELAGVPTDRHRALLVASLENIRAAGMIAAGRTLRDTIRDTMSAVLGAAFEAIAL